MVEKSKRQELIELLFTCLETKRENDFFDMKLKWHERIDAVSYTHLTLPTNREV